MIEPVWRCSWRLWSCELGGCNGPSLKICTWRPSECKLGGHNWASLEMHLEAVIKRVCTYVLWGHEWANLETIIKLVWRYISRPQSCEHRGRNWASLEMHLEAIIEWVCGYALAAHDSANLEAAIEQVWRCTWRPWSRQIGGVLGGGQSASSSSGGRQVVSWDYIHWLTRNCGNVENWVQHGLPKDERLAGSGRQLMFGWCSTQCIEYLVYACTRCMLYSVLALDQCMQRSRGMT